MISLSAEQLAVAAGVSDVQMVFDTWVKATERSPSRTKLTPDRRRVISAALKSHGVDVCLAAVRNIGADAWARGANDRRKRFDDVEHALKGTKRIESWAERVPEVVSVVPEPGSYEAARARRSAALRSLVGGGTPAVAS